MASKTINRRAILKGIGSVAIGLPFLEEMLLTSALASTRVIGNEPPVRAFNVFFGLGIPAPLQTEGFDGVLEPLKELGDKLLIMRNVDQVRRGTHATATSPTVGPSEFGYRKNHARISREAGRRQRFV